MSDEWKKMERAKEDAFFQEKEKESLERIAQRKPRLSPITGKPMVQKEIQGVIIDQCEDSRGIWLDAGELLQIVQAFTTNNADMIRNFFSAVLEKK